MQSNLYSLNKEIGIPHSMERLTYKMEREEPNVKPRSPKFLSVHSLAAVTWNCRPESLSLCPSFAHWDISIVRHLQTTETCAGLALWLVTWCHPGLWLADDTKWAGETLQAPSFCLKCQVPALFLLSPHVGPGDIMSGEQRRPGRGEWQRRRYKVHHYWRLSPSCASFRFLSGLVVSRLF